MSVTCPPAQTASQYPPKSILMMLRDVANPAAQQSLCPLTNQANQYCFVNQQKADATQTFFDVGTVNDFWSINRMSLANVSGDQYYLPPPVSQPFALDNIEFIAIPPSSTGQTQCSAASQYTPAQCTVPQGDCTTRCLYNLAMPCIQGTDPQPIGPCLTHDSWQGWSLQGYQCIPTTYRCDYSKGQCVLDASGAYPDLKTCSEYCIECPSQGFFVAPDANGVEQCYRNTYNAVSGSTSTAAICAVNDYNGNCGTATGACGAGYTDHCSCDFQDGYPGTCTDTLVTPYLAWQCTTQGYQQCTNKAGCTGSVITVDSNVAGSHCQVAGSQPTVKSSSRFLSQSSKHHSPPLDLGSTPFW